MSLSPMFPLGSVLLPGEHLPLHIFEPRYQEMVQDCLNAADGPTFGVVLIARGKESGGGDVRHDVATMARIVSHAEIGDGRLVLECVGDERVRVDGWLIDDPYPLADVRIWPDEPGDSPIPEASFDELQAKILDLYTLVGQLPEMQDSVLSQPDFASLPAESGARLYALAALLPIGQADRLDILTAPGPQDRFSAVTDAVENATAVVQFRLL